MSETETADLADRVRAECMAFLGGSETLTYASETVFHEDVLALIARLSAAEQERNKLREALATANIHLAAALAGREPQSSRALPRDAVAEGAPGGSGAVTPTASLRAAEVGAETALKAADALAALVRDEFPKYPLSVIYQTWGNPSDESRVAALVAYEQASSAGREA